MNMKSLLLLITCLVSSSLIAAAEDFEDASGQIWHIKVEGSGSPVFFLPHSDEKDALITARRYIQETGKGKVVWLDCGGQRMCNGIDPNRYFGHCTGKTKGMDSFRKKIFSYFPNEPVVIALHSNKGCAHGSVICTDNPYEGVLVVNKGNKKFPSDIVIYNGPDAKPTGSVAKFSACLSNNNLNQFYERAGQVNDCSMSEAATAEKRPYYNIDFERGGTDRQYVALKQSLECAPQLKKSPQIAHPESEDCVDCSKPMKGIL